MSRSSRIAVLAAACLAALPATAANADVRKCGFVSFQPNTDNGAFDIRAVGVSCRTARSVARASRDVNAADGPLRYRVRHFQCRGRRVDENLVTVRWRCVRGDAVVRFARS